MRPVRRAYNLTTFMCQLSWNLGASTSWNPLGLSRPVMGLLYLFFLLPSKCYGKKLVDLYFCSPCMPLDASRWAQEQL
jgi:hypothetical protein